MAVMAERTAGGGSVSRASGKRRARRARVRRADDAVLTPRHAAWADRRLEQGKAEVRHGAS
jgi:hypothetical protein